MLLLTYLMSLTMLSPSFLMISGQINISNPLQESTSLKNPPAVRIEMVSKDSYGQRKDSKRPYRVGDKVYVKLVVTNNSEESIKATVVDTYYQNRPQLFKNGRLIHYREEITKLVRSKDADPEFVRIGSNIFLEPHTPTDLEELNLSDWYGPLEPGLYKLINRHRFEIDGPWTADSCELLFEVVPQQ